MALSLCQELEKYIFQDFCLPRFCYAAGKFCKVFPAKKTGGRAAGKMHGQLFPGQKTDRLPANNGEKARLIRRPMCKKDRRATRKRRGSADLFCNYQKEYCAKYRQTKQKTSAFLPRFNTRKDPVFSDRALVVAGTELEPALLRVIPAGLLRCPAQASRSTGRLPLPAAAPENPPCFRHWRRSDFLPNELARRSHNPQTRSKKAGQPFG